MLASRLGIVTLPLPPTTVMGVVDTLAKAEYLISKSSVPPLTLLDCAA